MFHCNGWCFTWGVTAMGATHVCLRKVVPEDIYRIINSNGVTHLCAVPTVLIGLSAYATTNDIKLKKRLEIMTAGTPPAPTVHSAYGKHWRQHHPDLWPHRGLRTL
jgi:fatty-acyl-CoA synthase